MKSGAFAGDEIGDTPMGVMCARISGDTHFYVHIGIGNQAIQGLISRFQMDKLIEVLSAERDNK